MPKKSAPHFLLKVLLSGIFWILLIFAFKVQSFNPIRAGDSAYFYYLFIVYYFIKSSTERSRMSRLLCKFCPALAGVKTKPGGTDQISFLRAHERLYL